MLPDNRFDRLPTDIIREIFYYDSTYHNHYSKVLEELKKKFSLLAIILSAHYTSSSYNYIARINSKEHQQSVYPPCKHVINRNISQLYYRYFIDATSNT